MRQMALTAGLDGRGRASVRLDETDTEQMVSAGRRGSEGVRLRARSGRTIVTLAS